MKNKMKFLLPLLILVISISIGCKKEKSVQTELPSNYTNEGTITVKSKNISICIYDNDAEDGDIVDLIFNGSTLARDYTLLNAEKCFDVTLESGNNWIGVNILDEGTNPPASVTVKIDDGVSIQEFAIDGEVGKKGGYIIKL